VALPPHESATLAALPSLGTALKMFPQTAHNIGEPRFCLTATWQGEFPVFPPPKGARKVFPPLIVQGRKPAPSRIDQRQGGVIRLYHGREIDLMQKKLAHKRPLDLGDAAEVDAHVLLGLVCSQFPRCSPCRIRFIHDGSASSESITPSLHRLGNVPVRGSRRGSVSYTISPLKI
jgi:hypothetical protein